MGVCESLAPSKQRGPGRESFCFHHRNSSSVQKYMSRRKFEYLQYLKSEHWDLLRNQAFERDGWRCQKCNSKHNLQGHHKRYRKDLYKCTVDDIETLCFGCHRHHHKRKNRIRRERRKHAKRFFKALDPMVRLVCVFEAA